MFTCPECRAGKCRNCDGTALDTHQDEITVCGCTRPEHGGN